jgi:hypothetical protein
MNCSECQAQLADLSADTLAADQSLAMSAHFKECAHCYGEWAVFERTLFIVSTTSQALPSPLASEQMWHRCAEHIFQKVEAERHDSSPEYSRPEMTATESAGWRDWFARQPRWSWASLAGAFALFGAVWFLAPGDAAVVNGPAGREAIAPEAELVMFPSAASAPGQTLSNPPAVAAALVNHHTGMTVDPFTDYVGNTMVSYSATAPVGAAPRR